MYSYRVEQAIRAATVLHREQNRKGALPLPYVSHLIAVALILHDYTDNEDVLVAGLLHDTLEDTDYTYDELKEDFGGVVAEIVLTVTEPTHDGDTKLPWLERKHRYARQLKKGDETALLVAAADKIHNFRTMVEEYCTDYNRFLQDFGKNLPERLEAYQAIANVINARLKNDIVHEFNHVFDEYKQFLINVETSLEKNF
jgi:(p)ppGpp synthase/HD superfamily hydrolase